MEERKRKKIKKPIALKFIKDITIRRETALHIALNNNELDAFELLIRWLQRTTLEDASSLWKNKLLNWKNEEGNNLLHIAVSNNQPQVGYFHSWFLIREIEWPFFGFIEMILRIQFLGHASNDFT
jgi:hypothetical protein